MTIYESHEVNDLYDLYNICWSGALSRIDEAIEYEIDDEFFNYIVENLDGEFTELTEVNDFIWFDCDEWLEEHKPKDEDEDNED